MGKLKQGLGPHTRREFLGNAAVLGGAFAVGKLCTSCAHERVPAKMRCTGYRNGRLRVHLSGKNGGDEVSISIRKLGIPEKDSEPLSYFCTYSGDLFWVTKENVYIRTLSEREGKLEASRVLDARHTEPDEYGVGGVRVVDADIWMNPDARWEEITVATLTNTGLLQARRFSLRDEVENTPDRAIYDLKKHTLGESRWPEEGVGGAHLRVLGSGNFAAIPIGERGAGGVSNFYVVSFEGNEQARFVNRKVNIGILHPKVRHPELVNISEVSRPVRYNRGLGGWVVDLVAEKENRETFQIFSIVHEE